MSATWNDSVMKDFEKQVRGNLKKAAKHLEKAVEAAINLRGESFAGQYPKKVTGDLKKSIKSVVIDLTAYVGSSLDYSYWLEVGTSRMAARPFLMPTFLAEQDRIFEIITTPS